MAFDEQTAKRSVGLVQQICHIEQYRQDMAEKEGRRLSGEQAAQEWAQKCASGSPKLGEAH